MPDANTGTPKRLEAGGQVVILDGATEYPLLSLEPGTVVLEPGGYEILNWRDRGEQQFPLEGGENLSTVRMTLKLGSMDASHLVALSRARDTATGKLKAYGLQLRYRDFKGSTAGDEFEFVATDGYFVKPVTVRAGEQFDLVDVEMQFIDPMGNINTHTFA